MATRFVAVLVYLVVLLTAVPAFADYGAQSMALVARALTFAPDYSNTRVRVALIIDPNNPTSVEEAREIVSASRNEAQLSSVHMEMINVPIAEIDGMPDADVYWITRGLRPYYKKVAAIATSRRRLSASSDLDCAAEQLCVLGVQARPSVKIVLSSAAASRCGISFQPVFRMMVTER